jgi:hypothetical protein
MGADVDDDVVLAWSHMTHRAVCAAQGDDAPATTTHHTHTHLLTCQQVRGQHLHPPAVPQPGLGLQAGQVVRAGTANAPISLRRQHPIHHHTDGVLWLGQRRGQALKEGPEGGAAVEPGLTR